MQLMETEELLIYDGDDSGSGWSSEGENDGNEHHANEIAGSTTPDITAPGLDSDMTKVKSLLESIKELSPFQQRFIACELRDICDTSMRNTVIKYWQKAKRTGLRSRLREERIQKRRVVAGIHKPAWEVPLIFKGDAIPQGGKLFMDIEDIDLKLAKTRISNPGPQVEYTYDSKHLKVPATIAVVNEAGTLVLWAFISWPRYQICQHFTSLTGLSWKERKAGIPLQRVHQLLDLCLAGNTLVGFAIRGDLRVLQYEHGDVEDLQDFAAYTDGRQPYSLKSLAAAYLNKTDFQSGRHSAIQDARITLALYQHKAKMEANPFHYPRKDVTRIPREKFTRTPGDFCRCDKNVEARHSRHIRVKKAHGDGPYYAYV